MRQLFALLAAAMLVAGCATATTVARGESEAVERERDYQIELYIATMLDRRGRLANLAYPILTANADLCGKRVRPLIGASWTTEGDLDGTLRPHRSVLVDRYGVSGRPTVVNVIKGGPAEAAGLRRWDVLMTLDGKPIPMNRFGNSRTTVFDMLQEAGADGQIEVLYRRGEQTLSTTINTRIGCAHDVVLVEDESINAFADGKDIYITMGMYRFVESDTEMQAVIAHELAHNSEGHIDKKLGNFALGSILDIAAAAAGVPTEGMFGHLGGMMFSQEFEREADYVSVYMLEKAGIDTSEVATIWRRLAMESPDSIIFASSHPTTAERFTNLDAAFAEVQSKRQRGEPVQPSRR